MGFTVFERKKTMKTFFVKILRITMYDELLFLLGFGVYHGQKHSKETFLVMSFLLPKKYFFSTCFSVLVPNNVQTLKIHVFFCNVVLFRYIKCYSFLLVFWDLKSSKTLIMHKCLFVFPYRVFYMYFGVFIPISSKSLKNYLFLLMLFSFSRKGFCMHFSVLYNKFKNIQNTHFTFLFFSVTI